MVAELALSLLVTPIVEMAIKKVGSLIGEEFHSTFGVKKEVEKLEKTLTRIKAVLKDAEEKQQTNHSLKEWLRKLEDASYDAEDILDEFSTEVHMRNIHVHRKQRLGKLSFQKDIASRIKKILTKLDEIDQERNQFQLVPNLPADTQNHAPPRTSMALNRKDVVGRENDRNKIVQLLLSGELDKDGEISVIPIIGMGGLGKTTLAQLVYNDQRVKDCFEFRMWVCVPVDFDLSEILQGVIEFHAEMKYDINLSLNLLESRFREFLAGKKFLLVLDDVWNEDYMKWLPLKNILNQGGMGSKVLVTSRIEQVSNTMGTQVPYRLGNLSEHDCRSVFNKIAFEQSADNLSSERWSELESIGRDIVRKCQYLPLAVEVMAGLLRGNHNVREWQRILRNDIWDAEGDNPHILPALKLSYDHLSSHLKQCYAFCSIFPKDYIFDKKELVKLWVAEGFLQSEEGSQYFDKLLVRSFFQPLNVDEKERYLMHDLIHDLARHVSRPYCCQIEDAKDISDPFHFRHASLLCKDVGQPLTNILLCNSSKGKGKGQGLQLRTLLLPNEYLKDLNSQTLHKMFHTMTYIRVLDLSSTTILELPQSIDKLKLLRHLNLSKTEIPRLPDTLCNLYNLQTLKLLGCLWLFELPKDLSKLVNLQHLELDDMFWYKVTRLPPRMGKLTRLQNLHTFHISSSEEGYGIEELKDMAHLAGTLRITKLENAAHYAREAKLNQKESLDKLVLEWSNIIKRSDTHEPEDHQVSADQETVLEDLQPHSNLKELQICNYRGTRLPVWMKDGLLQKLVTVSLKHCTKYRVLLLGRLPHLQQLCLKGMQELEDWPEEVFFPSLTMLKISGCPKLRKLPSFFPNLRSLKIKNCDSLKALAVTPSLMSLILVNNPGLEDWKEAIVTLQQSPFTGRLKHCTKRRVLLLGRLPHLQQFCLKGMQELEDWPEEAFFPSLTGLKICNCPKLRKLPSFFPNLRSLKIKNCDSLKALAVTPFLMSLILVNNPALEDWKEAFITLPNNDNQPIGKLGSYQRILELKISCCPKISALPCMFAPQKLEISECELLTALPVPELSRRLQHLAVDACEDGTMVKSIPATSSLYSLVISNISNITSLPTPPHLPGLKALYIHDCKHLVSLLCEEAEAPPLQHLTSLELLSIQSCPELVGLPAEGLGVKLEYLMIGSCPNLECLGPVDVLRRLASLKDLYIEDCPKLKCLPKEGVPPSLEHLVIQGCPQLMEQCRKEGGGGGGSSDWTKIKDIPDIEIDSDSSKDTIGLPHEPSSESTPSSSAPWYHHFGFFTGQT